MAFTEARKLSLGFLVFAMLGYCSGSNHTTNVTNPTNFSSLAVPATTIADVAPSPSHTVAAAGNTPLPTSESMTVVLTPTPSQTPSPSSNHTVAAVVPTPSPSSNHTVAAVVPTPSQTPSPSSNHTVAAVVPTPSQTPSPSPASTMGAAKMNTTAVQPSPGISLTETQPPVMMTHVTPSPSTSVTGPEPNKTAAQTISAVVQPITTQQPTVTVAVVQSITTQQPTVTVSPSVRVTSVDVTPMATTSSPSAAPATSSVKPAPATSSVKPALATSAVPPVTASSTATTAPPPTPKKYDTNFKITNATCTTGIKENDPKDQSYKNMKTKVEDAVKEIYKNDPAFKGAEVTKFACGSVIAGVSISSTAANSAAAVKKLKDRVAAGTIPGFTVDTSSFADKAVAAPKDPVIYVTLETKLSNKQFCTDLSDLKTNLADKLLRSDGTTKVKASEVVFFDNKCAQLASEGTNIAKPRFYISTATNINTPDKDLTTRASKIITQFIDDGTTWRLGGAFDKKVVSAKLGGNDAPKDEKLTDVAIVFIGIGVVIGVLLLIIVIILIIRWHKKKNEPEKQKYNSLTIENQAYDGNAVMMTPVSKDAPNAIVNEAFDQEEGKTKLRIDDHDYEYPSAPQNGSAPRNGEVVRVEVNGKNEYQDLDDKPAPKDDPPSTYQPLSAEEEAKLEQPVKVNIEPEVESAPAEYDNPVHTYDTPEDKPVPKIEPKELTFEELALRKADEDQMRKEFESLDYSMPNSNVYPAGIAEKNRLMNVVPRPETRVILSSTDDELNSDYINANFVRDSQQKKKYIATQGPLQNTAADFWRMIWEQHASLVVMVTPLVQMGMHKDLNVNQGDIDFEYTQEEEEKCYQYWPPDSIARRYGNIEVQLKKKELKPDFTVTTMSVKSGDEARDVILYRYMTWPEDNIPDSMKSVVTFLLAVREAKRTKDSESLTVFHCSDGVGMTGSFIAIDLGMQSLEEKRSVDVFGLVKSLRKDRAGAVQVFGQYKFIYRALYEYAVHIGANQAGDMLKSSIVNQSDADSKM